MNTKKVFLLTLLCCSVFLSCPIQNIIHDTSYSVIYHGNGNTGGDAPVDANSYFTDDEVTVCSNSGNLSKSGYVFIGWNTQSDGNGILYKSGTIFTIETSDVELYATWALIGGTTYQVRHYRENLDGSYSIFETDTLSGTVDETVVAVPKVYTDYFENEDHDERIPQGTVTSDGSLLLKLFYDRKTLLVTYHGNGNTGGDVPIDGKLYVHDENVIVLGNMGELERTGYTFDSWNTAANGSGTSYEEDDDFPMPLIHVHLYAIWIPNTYLVSFDSDGGSTAGLDQILVTYDSVYPELPSSQRDGAIFVGWYTETLGGGTHIIGNSSHVLIAENHTLYASWRDYIVGDQTSNGGYIFYFDDTDSYPWTYLEAAPNDLRIIEGEITVDKTLPGYNESPAGYLFGLYKHLGNNDCLFVNGTKVFDESNCTLTEIGTGQANTTKLTGAMEDNAYLWSSGSDETTDEYAAKLCEELIFNGLQDWFLPSKEELEKMYEHLYQSQKGEMEGLYVSSSEYPDISSYVWVHNFYNGNAFADPRYSDQR